MNPDKNRDWESKLVFFEGESICFSALSKYEYTMSALHSYALNTAIRASVTTLESKQEMLKENPK